MEISNWTVEEKVTGTFTPAEAKQYWDKLRVHFITYLVYPRVFTQQSQFHVKIGQVPPILHLVIAGEVLFNTEHKKNSYVLKNIDEIQGSQNKLIELVVAGEFDPNCLDKQTNNELKILCQRLDFQHISRFVCSIY